MTPETHWDTWQQVVGHDDVDALEVLGTAAMYERYFQAVQGQAARLARAQGRSWQEIADAVGTTKQTAWKKWRPEENAASERFADPGATVLAQGALRPFEPLIQQVVDSCCAPDDVMRPKLVDAARQALEEATLAYGTSGGKAPFPVYASWWIRQGITRRRHELRAE